MQIGKMQNQGSAWKNSAAVFAGFVTVAAVQEWYPIGLAVTRLPCSWLGGVLYRQRMSA
jgi:hypothetical protein